MGFLISKRDGANLMLALADGGAVEVFDAGDAPGLGSLSHVFSPNTLQSFGESFVPGTGGSILAVVDFTPQATGIMLCSASVEVEAGEADQASASFFFVPNLTAITGGSPLAGTVALPASPPGPAQGITLRPASTTPAFSGVPSDIDARATFVSGGQNDASLHCECTVQAVVGERCAIVLVVSSAQNATWDIIGSLSVHELA